ncbi:MAG: hypothetical protein AAGA48_36605 [Myxococcota bacterium]
MRGLWLVGLLGCANRLDGNWQGSCVVDTKKGEGTYTLSYLVDDTRGELTGSASVLAPFLTEAIAGDLTGSVDGDAVSLTVELGDEVLGFTLRHDLTEGSSSDSLDGPCEVQVQQEAPFAGSSTLERTDDA